MDIIFNGWGKVNVNINMWWVEMVYIVVVCKKVGTKVVATKIVVAIFIVAETYFISSMNEALNKIESKTIVSELLMNW